MDAHPCRRHLASLIRRHWPVVDPDAMLQWSARRLRRWAKQGVARVAVTVDLGGLTVPVERGLERLIAKHRMVVDVQADHRLALDPAPASRSDSPFYCRDYWRDSTGEVEAGLARFRQRLLNCSRRRRTVLFIGLTHHNTPTINYLASALADRDIAVFAVFLHEPPPTGIFVDAFDIRGSLGLLWRLVRGLPSLPIYLQAHARWAFLGILLKRINPSLRVCQEIYDWTALFVPDAHAHLFAAHGVYSLADIALSKWAELAAIRNLDAVFYKNGGPPMQALLDNANGRATQLLPAPPQQWIRPVTGIVGTGDRRWRLVYAGQIKGGSNAPEIFGDMYYLPLVRDLTCQPIDVAIYWPIRNRRGEVRDEFREYLAEASRNRHFSLHEGRPAQQLIADINGRYDFGLLLYYFEPRLAVGRAHIESALASKLFTYIAAGLPVIISAEFRYMAGLVRDWGIGLVVERDEVGGLADRLRTVDIGTLRDRVTAAQRRYFMEANVSKVLDTLLPAPTNSTTRSANVR